MSPPFEWLVHILAGDAQWLNGEWEKAMALKWWWARPGILKELHLQKLETITLYNIRILKYYESFNQKILQNNLNCSNDNIFSDFSLITIFLIIYFRRIPIDPKSILTPTYLAKIHHLADYYHLFNKNDYHAAYKTFLHAQFQDANILEEGDSSNNNQSSDFDNGDTDVNGSEVEEVRKMIEHELLTDTSSTQGSIRLSMISDVISKMMR
ncbi:10198_t:CDS:2 [Ambispora gerdemannii]|uniref:10198_t:CDS:1 n=1 Tax=Ambispora gerdemannii TaxID=144530 RepID=A0A9N9C858_9GLOM|nr:10198_t:CDS:2 [Ambispora gerdemannii]